MAADGAAGPAQLKPFTQVDNILNGIKRANNPLEQPIKFEFINIKAAKQFGIYDSANKSCRYLISGNTRRGSVCRNSILDKIPATGEYFNRSCSCGIAKKKLDIRPDIRQWT